MTLCEHELDFSEEEIALTSHEDYLERIIKPEIRSVTREVIGEFLPEELNIQTNKLYIYPKFSKIYQINPNKKKQV